MNFASLIPSWVFLTCIIINALLAGVSISLGLKDLLVLNILSGISCYVGYVIGKNFEKEK